jgi:hypothetical protein
MRRELTPTQLKRGIFAGLAGMISLLVTPHLVGLSDSLWWQVFPWVLLVAFWTFVVIQHRRGKLGR